MPNSVTPIAADLAPGDQNAALFDFSAIRISRITSTGDPLFAQLYRELWNEFGEKGELETESVLNRRLGWESEKPKGPFHLRYEMLGMTKGTEFIAVRDHSVIVPEDSTRDVIIHLSHVLIAPQARGYGLIGWLRAFPIQLARRTLKELSLPIDRPITLVCEMEPLDPKFPERIIRLKSYSRAGFLMVDPSRVGYLQPDFSSPEQIDLRGGPQPLPLRLIVRRVGRESSRTISGKEIRGAVQSLYDMYGACFRDSDMVGVRESLQHYPPEQDQIQLLSPLEHLKDGAGVAPQAKIIRIFYDPGFAAPIGNHIMPIRKFSLVAEALRNENNVKLISPAPVSEVDLARVHSKEYIDAVKTGTPKELAESQKFPWSEALFSSVLLTAGGVLAASKEALRSGSSAALVSGFHHSHRDRGEGFCTFNGLIIALEALREEGLIKNAAILDMDLHYGNGTALLAESRPWINVLSIYGNDYWNNVAYRDVTSRKHKDGTNHKSAALPENCDRQTLLTILEKNLPLLLKSKPPELLLYQAGADPYFEDPYSPLKLNHDDLRERDRVVFNFAVSNQVPIAWVLAGGYTQDISKIVQVHVNTFHAWNEVFNKSK